MKSPYIVTESGGTTEIAGKRSPGVGHIVHLTEDQAKYEMMWGHVTPFVAPVAPAVKDEPEPVPSKAKKV